MNRLLLALPFATSLILAAEPDDHLVLDNGGLKNLYRLVIHEFDESATSVSGALEIRSYDPDELDTRIPFTGTIRFEEDGPERLELSPSLMVSFAAPEDPSNPKPPKPQTIRGLFHGWGTPEPGVSLELWDFDPGSGNWTSYTMNFGEVSEEGGAADPAAALDKESLGGIRLGASAEQVKRKVGERLFFGEEVFWGAIGEFGQPWLAPDQSVEFQMFRTTKKEEPVVGSITVSGKSTWKTSRR